MHADQRNVDVAAVRRLIARQYPRWAELPVAAVPSGGTVNAIFRVGDGLSARFPLTGTAVATRARLVAEAAATEEFAARSTVPAPRHVVFGDPGEGFDLAWSIQTWVAGTVATPTAVADSHEFAHDLRELILTLRATETNGRRSAGPGRGGDLRDHDAWVAECIERSEPWYETSQLRRLWSVFRILPRTGPDVMTHGDLTPSNVLVRDGRLSGVLDSGGFGPADPALELVSAWHLLDAKLRTALQEDLGVADGEWLRGAAWAFEQAIGLVWYYRLSNPDMAQLGRCTMERLLTAREIIELTD